MHVFHELWRASAAARGWRAKLAVWIARPRDADSGAGAAAPGRGFDIASVRRFSTATAPFIRRYAAVQYAALVFPVTHFIAVQAALGDAARLAYALVIVASMLSVGALMEGRRNARGLELLRVAALGAAFAAAPQWFGWMAPAWLRLVVVVFMLASALLLTARTRVTA